MDCGIRLPCKPRVTPSSFSLDPPPPPHLFYRPPRGLSLPLFEMSAPQPSCLPLPIIPPHPDDSVWGERKDPSPSSPSSFAVDLATQVDPDSGSDSQSDERPSSPISSFLLPTPQTPPSPPPQILTFDMLIAMLSNATTSYNVVSISLVLKIMGSPNLYGDVGDTVESTCSSALLVGMVFGQLLFGSLGDVIGIDRAMALTIVTQVIGCIGSALGEWEERSDDPTLLFYLPCLNSSLLPSPQRSKARPRYPQYL